AGAPVLDWSLEVEGALATIRSVLDLRGRAAEIGASEEAALAARLRAMVRGWPEAVEAALGESETPGRAAALAARFATIMLLPPREDLYRRLDARFVAMLASGAVPEVRRLLDLNLDAGLPAMKALGVAELARFLNGETTLAEACAQGQAATRRYAKRQLTWLRHQMTANFVIEDEALEQACASAEAFMRAFLLTPGP
ncbi:MAG TPA: tRNA dimethylallyltransferase, partial [Candidatus Defluviicoccus seviourii]|nr:tRNA dimethylallyltransferase [Candidatus Defluviicoccus seviourii]